MNVTFSGTLLRFINFQKNISLDANTVNEALSQVVSQHPKARPVLYDGDGKVRQVHQIFVNGTQYHVSDFDQTLNPSDQMDVLTAIAGG